MSQHLASRAFDHLTEQTRPWIEDVAYELETGDAQRALQALRAVLHALRDELTSAQNAQLTAQFPTLLRGIYYEDWVPRESVHHTDLDTFIDRIARGLTGYSEEFDPYDVAQTVLAVLEDRVSGACGKIRASLPKDLRELWPQE